MSYVCLSSRNQYGYQPLSEDDDIDIEMQSISYHDLTLQPLPYDERHLDPLIELFKNKLNLDDGTIHVPYSPVKSTLELADLIRYIPRGLEEDTPEGRKFSPLLADMLLMLLFSGGAMVFPSPLNITLSEDAGLILKNTLRGIENLLTNKAEKKKEEIEEELQNLTNEALKDPELASALEGQINALTKDKERADRAELYVKIIKYVLFGTALGIGGGIDLLRKFLQEPSFQLLPKVSSLLGATIERDLIVWLRDDKVKDPNNPTGDKIYIPKPLWRKLAVFSAAALSGTGSILYGMPAVFANALLNVANAGLKMVGKNNDEADKRCNISLGLVTIVAIGANAAGFALQGKVNLGTYLKYSTPGLITLLRLDAQALQRAILEKLTGEDGEDGDDDDEKKKKPAPLSIRLTVLAIATIASLGVLYYKFSQPNQLSCSLPGLNSSLSNTTNTPATTYTSTPTPSPQDVIIEKIVPYAIGLLMAVPLKITGKLAKNVMDELPHARYLTPLTGALLLLAETISYPYQCKIPLIAVVAFTCFAAMASKLVSGAIKDFMLGEKKKKKKTKPIIAGAADIAKPEIDAKPTLKAQEETL